MCTFEEKSCLFDDDLALKERWMITASTVRKWDNTLDIGVFAFIMFTADCKNKPRTVPDLQILCVGVLFNANMGLSLAFFAIYCWCPIQNKLLWDYVWPVSAEPSEHSYILLHACQCKLELVGLIYMH